ncbi:alpha/beta hydrolase [Hwanghaeella sp.]|uniref:alpha/beta hydrolase n=1 Tax=Hwanghaeella sp. TaxID=2605943 RepID=UPI003CCC21BD
MLMDLDGPEESPASGGKAKQLVILVHGLGADGSDLIALAPHLASVLPDAHFIAPDGPFPCDMAPYGRQWFSLQDRDPHVMLSGIRMAAPILDGFIDQQMTRFGLDASSVALVGFSQGTMMSLHVAPRRPDPLAAVVGFSGALLAGEALLEEARSRPPILLVHGDADDVVPVQATPAAAGALQDAGFAVETLICPGVPHSIDPAGLRRAMDFLARYLNG